FRCHFRFAESANLVDWAARGCRNIFTLADRARLASRGNSVGLCGGAADLESVAGPNHVRFLPGGLYTVPDCRPRLSGWSVAGLWLAKATGTGWQLNSGKIAILGIGLFVLAALALSAYFLPLWTGDSITWQQWQQRMWFQSWI